VLVLALAHLALFLFVVGGRVSYPYELEWMEGSCVDLVTRILHGKLLYQRPTLDYVPYLYAPLYFYLSAAVSLVTGPGFLGLRVVSVAATLGCLGLVARWVRRETGGGVAGWVAAGGFAACYAIGGAWLDLGRVDALFLLLLLATAYTLRFRTSDSGLVMAAAVGTLAILTKQTAVPVCFALAVGLAPRPRRMLVFAAALAVLAGGTTWGLDRLHDGWYWFFNFGLPARHSIMTEDLTSFWMRDLAMRVPVPLVLGTAWVVSLAVRRRTRDFVFFGCVLGGMVGTAYLSRLHRGGYDNVLLPAYLVLALFTGFALAELWTRARAGEERWGRLASTLATAAFAVQLALLMHDPRDWIPTAADRAAGDALVARMAAVDGDVLVPSHGYLALAAGKRPHAHLMALMDMRRSGEDELADELEGELDAALDEKRFGALFLDTSFLVGTYRVKPNYRKAGRLFEDEDVFWPTTGLQMRPKFLWEPRR
jgi:hypothetical protein